MAGGINPFGFAVSAPPAPAPRAPIDLPSAPFGFAPPPSKWQQTAAILNEYNPIDAFWRLYNSDMAKGGAITDQNIEDGMMVGGTVMGGGAMIPKPANALNMGIGAGRAKAGGQTGINNYLYKGGQFLPTTEAPPGTWRIKINGKSSNVPNGSELMEPGKRAERPTPFSRSTFQVMGGGTMVNIDEHGIASINPRINWEYLGSTPDEKRPVQFKNLAKSKEEYSLIDLVELYNKGVRWIDTEPLDHVQIVDKAVPANGIEGNK